MKKILALILSALMLLSLSPAVFAEEGELTVLKVNPYGGEETDIDTVEWFVRSGKYYVFLPSDAAPDGVTVYYTATADVTLDGETLVCGGTAALAVGDHTLACGDNTYALCVMQSANLPAVYLETESGSLSYIHANKENKEAADIRIYENGVRTLDGPLKQIKGRGNATWGYPKKPYNIKFDKKTDLFGMGKAKKWTLLANYFDYSLIHNVYGWEFADAFGLPHTSEYRHVDLYINHQYLGNYVICESVEIADNRIDINDLEKANEKANPDVEIESLPLKGNGANGKVQSSSVKGSRKWTEIPVEPANVTGGYLLEYEYGGRYNNEPCGFVTQNGQPVVIKSPEYASQAEVNYIADYVDDFTEALYSETGYNSKGMHYSDYADVDSLVNMYILQEMSMNYDAAFSSFYAYKAENGGKLVFSPVWDMDNAFGSTQANMNVALSATDVWWVRQMGYHGIPSVLSAANMHAEFREAVKTRWAELKAEDVFLTVNNKVFSLIEEIAASGAMNAVRWKHANAVTPAAGASGWRSAADASTGFVAGRTGSLDIGFGANGVYLYYDVNDASVSSWSLIAPVKAVGDTVTVRAITGNGTVNPPSGKQFYCWNTAPDDSGTRYFPGDTMTLGSDTVILYAIFKTPEEIEAIEHPSQPDEPEEPTTQEPATEEPTTEEPTSEGPTAQQPAEEPSGGGNGGWSGSFWERLVRWFRAVFRAIAEWFKK